MRLVYHLKYQRFAKLLWSLDRYFKLQFKAAVELSGRKCEVQEWDLDGGEGYSPFKWDGTSLESEMGWSLRQKTMCVSRRIPSFWDTAGDSHWFLEMAVSGKFWETQNGWWHNSVRNFQIFKLRGFSGPCVGTCRKQQARWFWIPFPASILELRSPLYHVEACGAEVDDFASWMHGFPGFMLLGVCYMQGGLGHSERGKAQEACFGLEVVRCDNYDIHPYLAFVHRCTSVLLSEQNNTKLTTRNSVSTKQIVFFGDF